MKTSFPAARHALRFDRELTAVLHIARQFDCSSWIQGTSETKGRFTMRIHNAKMVCPWIFWRKACDSDGSQTGDCRF